MSSIDPYIFWTRALSTPLIVNLATVGPVGRIRKAPGTWGSMVGLAFYAVFFHCFVNSKILEPNRSKVVF